jgi:hypothetical protein
MSKLGLIFVLVSAFSASSSWADRVQFNGCKGKTIDGRQVLLNADRLVTYRNSEGGTPQSIDAYAAVNPEAWLKSTMFFDGKDSLDDDIHRMTLKEKATREKTTTEAGKCQGGGRYLYRTTKYEKKYTIQDTDLDSGAGWSDYELNMTCEKVNYVKDCDPCAGCRGEECNTCSE